MRDFPENARDDQIGELSVRDVYKTLNAAEKDFLERVVQFTRNNPLTEDQITLFAYFMHECSSGSMTKKIKGTAIRLPKEKTIS